MSRSLVSQESGARTQASASVGVFRFLAACALLIVLCASVRADERLEALEERAFRQAAALAEPSIVRIETVGGLDLVGSVLTPTGPTTGVVISASGEIITSSFNFASQPASIVVTTPDGRRHAAVVVASDHARMLTLLRIEADGLVPLEAAPKQETRVGQWAIALGRTYEPEFPNIAVGIVSAVGRIWGRALQTDANVSPMNYGGPLVDVQGRGLGIIVPLSPQESGETAGVEWYDSGIGFAVPMEDVYAAARRLRTGEDLKPGRMGVFFAESGPLAGEAVIDRVRPGSPAYGGGLQSEDRIVEADGTPIERLPQLRHILGQKYAGDRLQLAYVRDGERATTELTLTDELKPYETPLLGILPQRVPVEGTTEEGVVVRFVFDGSPAAEAGLQRRDRIVAVGGEEVTDAHEMLDQITRFRPGDEVEFTYARDGQTMTSTAVLAVLEGSVRDSLPTATIPVPENAADDDKPQTGRWTEDLDGDSNRSFWAYVPEGYNPAYGYGLVVWIHPSGDTMEAAMLRRWKTLCERRGLILVGPKANDISGWTPNDASFVTDLIASIRERYTIDPARIVVHTFGDGGKLAYLTAFREREVVRGVATVASPVRIPPPENHPEHRLQFALLCGEEDAVLESLQSSAEGLRRLKFPVWTETIPDTGHEYPDEDVVERVTVWIDALDRI